MDNPFLDDAAQDIVPALPRLNGQRFLVTWAHCDNEEINIVSLAWFLIDLPNFHWAEVSRELHEDGTPHYHAVVVFRKRFQRNMRAFDFKGKHPNIRSIRNGGLDLLRARHYIRKGDAEHHSAEDHTGPCTYTYEPETVGAVPRYTAPQQRLTWGEILDGATTVDEFLIGIRTHYPREYILRFDQVLTFAQTHFSRPFDYVPARQQEEFRVPDELDEWVESVLRQVSTPSPGCSFFKLNGEVRL